MGRRGTSGTGRVCRPAGQSPHVRRGWIGARGGKWPADTGGGSGRTLPHTHPNVFQFAAVINAGIEVTKKVRHLSYMFEKRLKCIYPA